MTAPVTLPSARERAARTLARNLGAWAVDLSAADAAAFSLPLHPPTERSAMSDQQAARAWVESWRGLDGVTWADRRWARIGTQSVPVRLDLAGAEAIAHFAGRAPASEWHRAAELAARARQVFAGIWPSGARPNAGAQGPILSSTVARRMPALLRLEPADALLTVDLAGWLSTHHVSGLLLRHVPLPGVDTKWLGHHRSLVQSLVMSATGRDGLGLRSAPERVRVRLLDRQLSDSCPLSDLEAPLAELARLPLTPMHVLVVENRETLIALPPLESVVAVEGGGFGANRLAALPWLRNSDVLYWGDLDSHGLAILDQFRAHVTGARSVLMDLETLLEHRALWVPEPSPSTANLSRLQNGELEVLERLHAEGSVRLEQERIPWPWALDRLTAALGVR